jgi:hypothetical protein
MTQQPTPSTPIQPGFPGGTAPFTPVSPEPFYTPPAPPARKSGGGASGMTIALAVAVLIAGCGVSFAVGRATAPGATASTTGAGQIGQGVPGAPNAGNPASGAPHASGGNLPNASFDLNGNGNGQGGPGDGGGPGGLGGAAIQGTVASTDGKTMTLKLANGQTLMVKLDASTRFAQQAAGSASDVAVGKTVIVAVTGRLDIDGNEGGSPASTVTVVP